MFEVKDYLENRKGRLYIGGVSAEGLADEFGTPTYVYSEERIRANYDRLLNAFKRHYKDSELYYPIKCNNNLAVLNLIRGLGAGADCSSPAEVYLAKKAGFKRSRILYSGNYLRDDEMQFALKEGLHINLDDLSQIDRLMKHAGKKKPGFLCLRINPGMGAGKFKNLVFAGPDAKFGVIDKHVEAAYRKAKEHGVKRFGIHMMTGSCITEDDYFVGITERLMDLAGPIARKLGISFEFVDIGGGFGIAYQPGEKELDVNYIGKRVVEVFTKKCDQYGLGRPTLKIEPGRYVVGDAGVLLTRVTSLKQAYKKFVGVDAGMNTLLRPALYGAYHQMFVANKLNEARTEKVNVVGPICENSDQLAKDRELPPAEVGDVIAILNGGAYGFGMGSQYNTRPRSAEVLVHAGKAELIRERETFADIDRHVRVPKRLRAGKP